MQGPKGEKGTRGDAVSNKINFIRLKIIMQTLIPKDDVLREL